MGKSDFRAPRHFGGNLDYGLFDRQLQRDKCQSCGLHVILCTQLRDELFTHLAASTRCMVLFSAKEVHVSWCLGNLCTHRLVPWCMHPAAATDHRGIHIPFDLLQEATLCTPVADYLFDFDSQGLIMVRSFTASSPWMSVGSCFLNCSNVFLTFSVIYSKFY